MGDIINLNQFRKQRAHVEKERKAKENRTKFGRTKIDREAQHQEIEAAKKELDAKHMAPSGESAPEPSDPPSSPDSDQGPKLG
ncbi:MAG: DUF4169 family protein [Rhodospirillales bacterium]|jgi:hypothetical protein|nr:DUF4169 family protein [Rhodospirillales bacterium]MBT4006238.1 DUF4169 family protein [Rhodospirillales bacterium]MBT5076729.1 DUF4169 family protein [Rhodospirillales bacterium]MBT5113182.1 DUF4169 family protein [Rhodospirillales bacterium]MBT5673058.1 DUF4169 family protein [Rhodospirillales bacterium]